MSPQQLAPNIAAIVDLVLQIAPEGGQDPALVLGIIERESNFNPTAQNLLDPNGGSFGLMQMQLPTARDMGYSSNDPRGLFDPATAITVGVAYLGWIAQYLARYGITGENATVAAYNAGVTRVRQGLPNYPYVNAVMAYREKWRGILATLPIA